MPDDACEALVGFFLALFVLLLVILSRCLFF